MRQKTTNKVLLETESNYNQMAAQWNKTRSHLWKWFDGVLPYVKDGDVIYDIGCGNGRVVELFDSVNVDYTGVDISEELISIAKEKYQENNSKAKFLVGDMLDVPLPDNSADVVFCVSALHHIPTKKLQLKALKEFYRICKPGGYVIMSNWYYTSPRIKKLLFKYTIAKLLGKSELNFGDIYVGWQDTEVKRFVHLFSKPGIARLTKKAGFKMTKIYTSEPTSRGFKNIVTINQK